MPRLYVKRGKRRDTYYTIIAGKYTGLGNERAEAEHKLREIIHGGTIVGSVADLLKRYINEGTAHKARRTVRDHADEAAHLNQVFGHMKWTDLKPPHVAQYLELNLRAGRGVRANREKALLSSAYSWAMRHGLVDNNPCTGVRRNPEKPRNRRPMREEVNTLIQVAKAMGASSYMVALLGVMVGVTGRRRAELINLTLHALTDDGITVVEAKQRAGQVARTYTVEWTPFLRDLVAEIRAIPRKVSSLYLFPTRSGQSYTDDGFKTMWGRIMGRYLKQGGEHFTAHDLRAMYVSDMTEAGRDPNTHRNPATTARVYDRRRAIKVTPSA